jgi:glutaredoxin-related protein
MIDRSIAPRLATTVAVSAVALAVIVTGTASLRIAERSRHSFAWRIGAEKQEPALDSDCVAGGRTHSPSAMEIGFQEIDVEGIDCVRSIEAAVMVPYAWSSCVCVLLFVRSSCDDCEQMVRAWNRIRSDCDTVGIVWAVVDFDHGELRESLASWEHLRLVNSQRVFAKTPQWLLLRDGIPIIGSNSGVVAMDVLQRTGIQSK